MSDFLTNLAARTLNAVPLVQPRLAARFEPIRSADHGPIDDPFGGEIESFIEPAAPPAPTPSISATEFESRAHSETNRHHFDTPPTNQLRPREPPIHESSHPSPAAPVTREAQSAPAPTVPPLSARESAAAPRLNPLPVLRPVATDGNDARSARNAHSPTDQPLANPPPRSQPVPRIAANSTTGGQVVVLPRVTPAAAPSQSSDRREPAPEPVPIIRVTIGRVDVRAIAPPAPAPPRESSVRANSLLSLDEYLKQRTGGRK